MAGRKAAARRPLHLWSPRLLITNIYVDGFNLYYGALKKHPSLRWLNLEKMCQLLLPSNTFGQIKYFTAKVSARPGDPQQPVRQHLYLRALATVPTISVHLGHFLTHHVSMPLVVAKGQRSQRVLVVKTEEKGSDVNLATHLVHDAHMGRFDIAVVVSNDSDLVEPIRLVRSELGKQVGVIFPYDKPSRAMLPYADFVRHIRAGVLAASQFPGTMEDANGQFTKPARW